MKIKRKTIHNQNQARVPEEGTDEEGHFFFSYLKFLIGIQLLGLKVSSGLLINSSLNIELLILRLQYAIQEPTELCP